VRVVDGAAPADAEVGRFLADALAAVPRLTRDQFEKLFGDSIQAGPGARGRPTARRSPRHLIVCS